MYLETLENLDIELTNVCNLKCVYCLRVHPTMKEYLKTPNILDYDTITSFILKLKKYKLKEITLMGNLSEPTLYPRFLDFIKFLKELDLIIHISSNANTHDKEWWKTFSLLLDNKDTIIFSVDGSTQDLYKKYRVGGKLETVKDHFQAFCSTQQSQQGRFCQIYLQTIDFPWYDCDKEYEQIKEIFDPEKKYTFFRTYTRNYYPEKESRKLAKLEIFRKKTIQTKIELGTALKPECRVIHQKNMYMNYLGDIIPCGVVYEKYLFGPEKKENKIPNVYETNKLETSFSPEFIKKFNDFFKEHLTKTIFKNYDCLKRCNKIYEQMIYPRNSQIDKD